MAKRYNLKNIRTFLTQGFTDEELRRFCYDEPDFRPVYEQLAATSGHAEIVDQLLEHAERKRLLDQLLAWAKESNPAGYEDHQPYEELTTSPTPATDVPEKPPRAKNRGLSKRFTGSATESTPMAKTKDDNRMRTARINMIQMITVAVISGIVSIIITLVATGYLLPDRAASGVGAGGSVPQVPQLDAPYIYFSAKPIDVSVAQCLEKANDGLERAGLTGQESGPYVAWGYAEDTTGLIWCHIDEGLVIFMAAGRDEGRAVTTADALRRSF